MNIVFSDEQRLHHGRGELGDGRLMPVVEMPRRAEMILARAREVGLGEVIAPEDYGRAPLEAVHAPDYLDFLETAWNDWEAEHGGEHDALPLIWPVRSLRNVPPDHIDGRLGYYALGATTPITAHTWRSATASANTALSAAALLAEGERAAFALCRPPGHHATRDQLGGYCFLNNAAIAAEWLRERGSARVAVLDVDYHHGNGTQAIFYDRPDVLFISTHADPRQEFPYFLGYSDECGAGAGEGFNLNLPLAWGSDWTAFAPALEAATSRIADFAPEVLVVSLGVDTFERDPISRFKLTSDAFPRVGAKLAALGLPTLFVMEGGYAVEEVGVNAVGVLTGFEDA